MSVAFAYDQEKVDLASGLEEAMGHLWALELNLNEGDYDLANTHALHPVTELYASMKPALAAADLAADVAIANALNSLADRTGSDAPLAQALEAVEETRSIIDYARNATIGPVSDEANFKLIQMGMLLETSIVEYGVAVSGGQIVEQAEFQDGLAFVVRSGQILDTIDAADIGHSTASSMKESLAAVQGAYDQKADPSKVESLTNRIIDDINGVLVLEYSPEKVDLAGSLEKTMGHLWALELNLNEGNYALANTHALHPVTDLYASMKPALAAADLTADAAVES
ncbi:MAG: PEFG-CTERM domain-containing protein, partial [Thaumarchaeota archaeon]|nr:PEFG-CTERM domain-containing protein [Nitrososphaerota archaeon]